jgi:hypothetical protein
MHSGAGSLFRACDGSAARMSGIGTCGLIWTCPVCALQLSERRRAELLTGMAHWAAEGGRIFLLTLTLSHQAGEQLAHVERGLAKALVVFKAGKAWRELSAQIERAGSVRSIEVTYSDANGWHPHSHELVFCKREPAQRLLDAARMAWVDALRRVGFQGQSLADALEHAFDWRGGDKAGEYVAKYGRDVDGWCIADELTRSHAKIAPTRRRDDHVTPFELVLWHMNGDAQAGALFREYAKAFKGSRALHWSPKLKARVGVADLTDEQIRAELGKNEPLPQEERIAGLVPAQWAVIVSREAEGELYELARVLCDLGTDRQSAIDEWVQSLKARPPNNSGRIAYRQFRSGNFETVEPADLAASYGVHL